jgi:glutathione reductase (NADPH)
VTAIEKVDAGLKLTLSGENQEPIIADVFLVATGRSPNIEGLGLENAQLDCVPSSEEEPGYSTSNAISVNEYSQTCQPHIYAVCDVTDRLNLTPVAIGEGRAFADSEFGNNRREFSHKTVATAVFTTPEAATVGLTEAQARERFGAVRVFKSEFKALMHTLSGSSERTFMKLLVDEATDRVVGLHMVGAEAGEIVQGFAVAMKAGATKAVFDSTIGIHPTAAEEFVTMREPVKA